VKLTCSAVEDGALNAGFDSDCAAFEAKHRQLTRAVGRQIHDINATKRAIKRTYIQNLEAQSLR